VRITKRIELAEDNPACRFSDFHKYSEALFLAQLRGGEIIHVASIWGVVGEKIESSLSSEDF
jgi:hypothetical protein